MSKYGMYRPDALDSPKIVIAALMLAGHILLFGSFVHFGSSQLPASAQAPEFIVPTQIIVQLSQWDKVAAPEVDLDDVPVDFNALKLVRFDDSDQDVLAGIVGPASAPRLSRFQSVDVRDFAQRAGIAPQHPVTVILSVQVGEDGGASEVNIVRSSGVAAADAAAIDYALALRWIPGTVDRNPRAMRVMLPVTLAVPVPLHG